MEYLEEEGNWLSLDDILEIHEMVIQNSESKDERGFIDRTGDLFQSAVYSVFQGFGDWKAYPTVEERAAALCFKIIKSHVFCNANKRTGMIVMLQTLEMNGLNSAFDDDALFDIIVGIGSGTVEYEDLLAFVRGEKKDQVLLQKT